MKLFSKGLVAAALSLSILIAGCSSAAPESSSQPPQQSSSVSVSQEQPKSVTDMAGRTIELPDNIEKAYCSNPVSTLMVYTFAPEKLLGWNYKFNDAEKKYILPEYLDLPVFGMNDAVNLEAIVAAKPQICFVAGGVEKADIENAEKLQSQLGVPVIMLDGALTKTAEVYKLIGEVFGMQDRANDLAGYASDILNKVASTVIPENERVTVYYGNGVDSLDTSPRNSTAAETVEMLGAINVADVESKKGSRIKVSAEQIIGWNPQVIFVNGEAKENITGGTAAQQLMSNPTFSTVTAVKDKKVYGIPKEPFSWLDRPVSANRLLGLKWAGNLLYPKYYDFDMNQEIKDFYKLFYHMEITDEQVETLING